MKKNNWQYRKRTERDYERKLKDLAKTIAEAAKKAQTVQEIASALMAITEQTWFQRYAKTEARKMVKSVLVENARTWREAAKKGTHSRAIHQALRAEFDENQRFWDLINKNTQYIKTIPESLASQVVKKAGAEALAGKRSGDILAQIQQEMPKMAEHQARRIARTEVAKAQAAVTQVRAEALGMHWYVWRTSEDQRVRSSHKHMEGVLCKFDSPPSPEQAAGEESQGYYNAGNIYNCRCYSEPLLNIEDFEPNSKVYQNGSIVRMSKRRFLEIAQ